MTNVTNIDLATTDPNERMVATFAEEGIQILSIALLTGATSGVRITNNQFEMLALHYGTIKHQASKLTSTDNEGAVEASDDTEQEETEAREAS